jgi:hypothetical protein
MHLASRNCQPQSEDAWKENQETGLFGHVVGQEEKNADRVLGSTVCYISRVIRVPTGPDALAVADGLLTLEAS